MKTMREAAREIGEATPGARIMILQDGERYDIGTVTFLSGSEPMETIVEVGDAPRRASEVVADMLDNDPEGRVQIFLRDSDEHASYFELAHVMIGTGGNVYLQAGAFIADCA